MRARRFIFIISVTGLFVLTVFSVSWAVPRLLNFQGTLVDGNGQALAGFYDMRFAIFDIESGGMPLWEESRQVDVVNGLYGVQLGTVEPLSSDLFETDTLFLEIEIYNPTPPTPAWEKFGSRLRLTSTAFAMKAGVAERVLNGAITSVMLSPGAVSSDQLSDQAVTASKIAGSQVTATHIAGGAVGSAQIADSSVSSADVGFNYAGSSGKGGPALDLACASCVSSAEVQPPLALSGSASEALVQGTNLGGGAGVRGVHGNGHFGYLGGSGAGVYGEAANGNKGWLGSPTYGVYGTAGSGYAGYFIGPTHVSGNLSTSGSVTASRLSTSNIEASGSGDKAGDYILSVTQEASTPLSAPAARFEHASSGNYGYAAGRGSGFYGQSAIGFVDPGNFGAGLSGKNTANGYGVFGDSSSGKGLYGLNSGTGNWGEIGTQEYAGYFSNPDNSFAYLGGDGAAIYGKDTINGNVGWVASQTYGVFGSSTNSHGIVALSSSVVSNHAAILARNDGAGPGIMAVAGSGGYAGVFNGRISTTVLEITGGSDLSEQFDIRGELDDIKPGLVVSIDPQKPGGLKISNEPYDKKVAGIISGANGVRPGMIMAQTGSEADGAHPIALAGRAYCWADADYGSIEPGDLLTTSTTPGHAMKVSDRSKGYGRTIGKAMTPLESGKGMVLVLISLQ